MGKHIETIARRSLEEWAEFAKRDDCLASMVPSDLRMIVAALRDEKAKAAALKSVGGAK